MKARIVNALRRLLGWLETERPENPTPRNCPFCGRTATLHELKGAESWYVSCPDDDFCFLAGPYRGNIPAAIKDWNRIQVKP